MTKLQKAEAAMEQARKHYAAYHRAAREARARLAATPEGKAFLTLRRSTRLAKATLLNAKYRAEKAATEERDGERLTPWTRFKASDSPFPMGE